MNYVDGNVVIMGDRVRLAADDGGVVVCVIETGEYSEKHAEAQWGYLSKGVLIEFPSFGLIHYDVIEDDVEFIGRAPNN